MVERAGLHTERDNADGGFVVKNNIVPCSVQRMPFQRNPLKCMHCRIAYSWVMRKIAWRIKRTRFNVRIRSAKQRIQRKPWLPITIRFAPLCRN